MAGLVVNFDKSNIFLLGVDESVEEELLGRTSFTAGTFPIRFWGLPLSFSKWSKVECHQLVDKITCRIIKCYARKFSYAGRLQKSMLVYFQSTTSGELF